MHSYRGASNTCTFVAHRKAEFNFSSPPPKKNKNKNKKDEGG